MTFFRIFFSQDNIFLAKTEMIASWKIVVIHAYNFSIPSSLYIIFFDRRFFFLGSFFFSFSSKRLEYFSSFHPRPHYFSVHFCIANFSPSVRGKGMRGSDAAYEKLICLFTSLLSGRRKRGWRSNICVRFKVWFDVIGRLVTEFPTRTE